MEVIHSAEDPEAVVIEIATEITKIMRLEPEAGPCTPYGNMFLLETGLRIPAEKMMEGTIYENEVTT